MPDLDLEAEVYNLLKRVEALESEMDRKSKQIAFLSEEVRRFKESGSGAYDFEP